MAPALAPTVVIAEEMFRELHAHLFPGDGDEHGAVLGVQRVDSPRGTRLLARRLYLAQDGRDYVPGERGYRMLTATFVRDTVLECADAGLGYVAVHCHPGAGATSLSRDDLASHHRGYPALRDLLDGAIAGGIVFSLDDVDGDIWHPGGERTPLCAVTVPGYPPLTLGRILAGRRADPRYDRQALLFGDHGQEVLRGQKVGVIGAGGAGSLILQYLGRLGVGHIVAIDPDRAELTNLPRLVETSYWSAGGWFAEPQRARILRAIGRSLARPKVKLAARSVRRASPQTRVDAIVGDVTYAEVAAAILDCDYIFLAADSMQARLVFNAIVHQYLIPGVQVGAKVQVNPVDGSVIDVFSVVRPVIPGSGCLWCNELISPTGLQEEALSPAERERHRYVDEDAVSAPSVITLNGVAASHAVNDYLIGVVGLADRDRPLRWTRTNALTGEVMREIPRRDGECIECRGRLGAADARRLHTRPRPARHGVRLESLGALIRRLLWQGGR